MPSQPFQESAFAEATGEVWLVLLTIEHADLAEPLRFVNNTENITSNGDAFLAFPFDYVAPDEGNEGAGIGRIRIDNVDRQIAQTIRELQTAPTVTVQIVLASDPDTIERELGDLVLASASWDKFEVSADLSPLRDHDEPGCSWRFTPGEAPALF
jgi:hypothetical protein